ncbi:MAG: hypothetical protein WA814_11910, partial [Candidatus Baltobacteraceae bacterium]
MSTATAIAGTTGNGWSSKAAAPATNTLTVDQSGSHVIIVLHIATPAAWAYDPATGGLSSIPVPSQLVSAGPIKGS